MIFTLLATSTQAIVMAVAVGRLPSKPDSPQPNHAAPLSLVSPKLPESLSVRRGNQKRLGAIEIQDKHIVSIVLHEGDVLLKIKQTWKDGHVVFVKEQMDNKTLDRHLTKLIYVTYDTDGRLSTQLVYSNGMQQYTVKYKYGSSQVPTGATIYRANKLVEVDEYEYDDTAWTHPIYLSHGFYFGEIKVYSTWHGERSLLATSTYGSNGRAIESNTIYKTDGDVHEIWEFKYGSTGRQDRAVGP